MASSWFDYVRRHAGAAPQHEIAETLGVSDATVSHWKAGRRPPTPRHCVQVANAYGRSVMEALAAAGFITEEEAAGPMVTVAGNSIRDFTGER